MPKANSLKILPFILIALLSVSAWAVDTDGDGYDDAVDAFPSDPGGAVDTDGDGMPDEIIGGTLIDSFESGNFSAQPWVVSGGSSVQLGTHQQLGLYKVETWDSIRLDVTFVEPTTVMYYSEGDYPAYYQHENIYITLNQLSPVNMKRSPVFYNAFSDGSMWNKHVYVFPAGSHSLRFFAYDPFYTFSGLDGIYITHLMEDTDDDNDGVADLHDLCPYDASINTYVEKYGDYEIIRAADADRDLICNDNDDDDDNDGVLDVADNCGVVVNPDQINTDGDNLGDVCDADDDNDGIPDDFENAYAGLDPLVDDAAGDIDGDGLTNLREYELGTNPEVVDVRATNDTDADFDSDVIWRNRNTGAMTVWEMQNYSKVSETAIGGLGAAYDLKDTFDLDSDGDADLILFNESEGKAIAWEMENNAKVSGSFLAGFPGYTIRGLGDLDADGDGDIVWQEVASGKVIVWLMENGAKQSGAFLGSLGAGSVVEAIGDFDDDGDADLLWSIPGYTSLVRWQMENGLKVSGTTIGGLGGSHSIFDVGHINKSDTTDDIVWVSNSGSIVIYWPMVNGLKGAGQAITVSGVAGHSLAALGDYDGDGDVDLNWVSPVGHIKLWDLENGALQQQIDVDWMDADSDIRP